MKTFKASQYGHPGLKFNTLALAVQNRHVKCVKILLSLGADPFASSGASVLNFNPGCPYWLALNVFITSRQHMGERVDGNSSGHCSHCHAKFTITSRRHNCNFCGHSLCQNCSKWKVIGLRACEACKNGYELAEDKDEYVKNMRIEKKQIMEGSKMISPNSQIKHKVVQLFHKYLKDY
jgi:hypothetical protein